MAICCGEVPHSKTGCFRGAESSIYDILGFASVLSKWRWWFKRHDLPVKKLIST